MTRRKVIAAAVLAAAPGVAHAHLTSSGLGPAYDGALHLLVTPGDLLPVIALAVLAGLRGKEAGRGALLVLPGAWCAGAACGWAAGCFATVPALASASAVVVGGLGALDARLGARAVALLAAALGLVHGGMNGSELASAGAGFAPALGAGLGIFVLVAILAGRVATLRATWTRIAARVAGSWIAAAGLFMLGWSLRAA